MNILTRQLIGLLLIMAGDVEVNPDPEQTPGTSTAPSPFMAGLEVLITEEPEQLRIFISKWDEKNDAAKNKKLIER